VTNPAVSETSEIVIVDLGAGNLRSVEKAVEAAADHAGISVRVTITAEPDHLDAADRIILPGVGAFAACMRGLNETVGLRAALEENALSAGKPLLGICVGMQMLADVGLEFGETPGLGWIPGVVRPFPPTLSEPVPHMGWNSIKPQTKHALFEGRNDFMAAEFYFLHSFIFDASRPGDSIALCDYGDPFVAAVAQGNIAGVQFHPEKSQDAGLAFLENFLTWQPEAANAAFAAA